MQHKLFYINDYFIGDYTIEVDILPNKYVPEQIEIPYKDFIDYMEIHGHLDGLPNMGLVEIQYYTTIEILPILHDYIVARHISLDKVLNETEAIFKHFAEIFKPFQS
jgi:hypothetical protein